MRIFVAVALDAALREAVAELRSHVNSAASALRWVAPGALHFTLKFLGEIPDGRVETVTVAAREVARRTQPFRIALSGVGAFPSPRRPQVVWVGVEQGSDGLIALARGIDATLQRMKFPRETRPFRPHLTVARAKHGSGPPSDLSAVLAGLAGFTVGMQTVDALLVMESKLHPAGASYQSVDEVRLGEAS